MVKRKKKFRRRKTAPEQICGQIHELLAKMGGSRPKSCLALLWENWEKAMGKELAELALPVGAHGNILVIAAENAIQMQELYFRGQEIKDRANIFLESEYFTETHVTLLEKGRKLPEPAFFAEKTEEEYWVSQYPPPNGKFLKEMDMESPVARCYALFVKVGK